jgi:ATP-dependent Clp protease ATP-binding subunit ClpC
MELANQEALRFNHEYIGTEHILLGMIKEGSGVGVTVLKNLGVDTQRLWHEVERLVKRGPDRITMGKLPQTPRAKKVIEYAIEEMREMEKQLNRRLNVGTEHILLGLLLVDDGIAAQVLMNFGLQIEQVRSEVLALEGKQEPLMEREPRTWEDKGENKLLIKREGSGAINQYERFTDGALNALQMVHAKLWSWPTKRPCDLTTNT